MKNKRLFLVALVLLLPLMLSMLACDDDDVVLTPKANITIGEVQTEAEGVTGVESADELIDDTVNALNETRSTLDTAWCLGSARDWEVRCGGDGVDPNSETD